MTTPARRRLLLVSAMLLLVLIAFTFFLYDQLDPGNKGDTTSDLVTPTFAADTALVFDVSPDESQVDFVTEVQGLELNGVFPVGGGTITLDPVGDELRVLVRLDILVDEVDTGSQPIDRVLRGAMKTGDYPIAFYVATSRDLVPVTEERITFDLDGTLEVNNTPYSHSMAVEAQLVAGNMWAIATSDLDLANHGVEFPALIDTSTIKLTARLQAYEVTNPETPAQ